MAKKLGIISDTHGLLRPEVMEILKDCDCILHGGDINKPEILDQLRPMAAIYAVRGNNDREWADGLAKTLRFTIEGVEFFMTHNKKDVAWELGGAQVVVFGHTHKYFEKMIDGRLWLNPGSCGRRRFDQEITMAVMTVDNGDMRWKKSSYRTGNRNKGYILSNRFSKKFNSSRFIGQMLCYNLNNSEKMFGINVRYKGRKKI